MRTYAEPGPVEPRLRLAKRLQVGPALAAGPLNYRPELDGVRAIAILLVLGFHAGCPLLPGGFIGVDVFFALSGFLITSILTAEIGSTGTLNYRRFLIRRFLRLLPAFWLMVGLYLAATALSANRWTHFGDAAIALTYTANFVRAAGVGRPGLLGHTWSLAVEEQFYLCWPLLLLLLTRFTRSPGRRALAAAGLACASFLHRNICLCFADATFARIYNAPDTHADGLLFGCAAGILAQSVRWRAPASFSLGWPPVALVGLLALALIGETESTVMSTAGLFTAALLTGSLLVCLVQPHESPIKRALAHPQLVYLGKISYGVYLWHFPIMKLLQTSGRDWEFVLIVGSGLSMLAAAVSFRVIEQPFLELKKRFEFRPPVEAAPPQPVRRSA